MHKGNICEERSTTRGTHWVYQLQSSPTLPFCAVLTSNSVGQALHKQPLGFRSGQCLWGPLAAAGGMIERRRPGAAMRVHERLLLRLLLVLRMCCTLVR